MPEPSYILSAVLISAAVTWALRALPFALLAPLRRSPVIAYLGERMPLGVMVILVGYTLRQTSPTDADATLPLLAALVTTTGLHLWRSNMLLSIFAGTTVYVALASTVFAP